MPFTNIRSKSNDEALSLSYEANEYGDGKSNTSEIKGRECYFSLTGDFAIQAYADKVLSTVPQSKKNRRLKDDITERLQFALVMFDKVVLHCSDPLRNELVLEILEEYVDWIKEGKIAFVFSSSIKSIRDDYKAYIDRKVQEYEEGYKCEKEIESLRKVYMNDAYYERVIELLMCTKNMIRKPTKAQYRFDRLVSNDLDRNSRLVTIDTAPTERTDIKSVNLTLYQLLKLRSANQRNGKLQSVFPEETTDEIINSIEEQLEEGNKIARSVILSELKEKIHKMTRQQKDVMDAISMRMDVLYCQMNSGERLILEFHPMFEKQSAYQMQSYRKFLGGVRGAKVDGVIRLDHFRKLMNVSKEEVDSFRLLFLACVADAQERMVIQSEKDAFDFAMRDYLASKTAKDRFPNIQAVLLEV